MSGVEQVLSCKKNYKRKWGVGKELGGVGFWGILVLLKKCEEFQPLKKKHF